MEFSGTYSEELRRQATAPAVSEGETSEQKIAPLEAKNAAQRAETTKLTTEREILRSAATWSVGRTN